MTDLTDRAWLSEQERELHQLCQAATEGEWSISPCCNDPAHTPERWGLRVVCPRPGDQRNMHPPDAALIVAMRNQIPDLLAALAALRRLEVAARRDQENGISTFDISAALDAIDRLREG